MNPPITSSDPAPAPIKGVAAAFAVAVAGTALAVALYSRTALAMKIHHVATGWLYAAAIAYGAAILGVAYAASRVGQRVGRNAPTPAANRYRRRLFTAMSVYALALMASTGLFAGAHPTAWIAWLLALAPAAAIVATIVVMGLYLREETDEFERSIASEAALWATGGLLAIATTWGFLEQFGLVVHIEAWAAFPLWAFCLGPATIIVRRRYQ